jgi:hypothetical protein
MQWHDNQEPMGAGPLFFATEIGHATVTKQLIEARCNINLQCEWGATPVYMVVMLLRPVIQRSDSYSLDPACW